MDWVFRLMRMAPEWKASLRKTNVRAMQEYGRRMCWNSKVNLLMESHTGLEFNSIRKVISSLKGNSRITQRMALESSIILTEVREFVGLKVHTKITSLTALSSNMIHKIVLDW